VPPEDQSPPPNPPPIQLGTPDQPFPPVPAAQNPTAIADPGGAALPVISASPGGPGWLVLTPCGGVETASGTGALGRAHVVLDPGHGGREPGAVGASGLTEKELNLAVALAARMKLEQLGATVILTRSADLTMSTGVRAHLARSVQPGLFVSIHHNGGAPASGDRPGTIVFTKSQSTASSRFGGLFYQALTDLLVPIGEAARERYRLYRAALDAHEEAVTAYDQSVAARDAALVANGQIPPTATTAPAERPAPDAAPSARHPITTTTAAPPPDQTTVSVPDTVVVPPPFEVEAVPEFRWAGAPNAGVRPWIDTDGNDILSVLRRSGNVPAALVEYLYLTNPVEEALLADPAFVDAEAQALVDSIVAYFSTGAEGTGHVQTQVGHQDIGGGGSHRNCPVPDHVFG
jgi:N-acetylmuramoyl-L-alanine amidase